MFDKIYFDIQQFNFRKIVSNYLDEDLERLHKSYVFEPKFLDMVAGKQEYDIVKKDWGFYATPSVNDRLKRQGYKTAYVKNKNGQRYIMLVEINKYEDFIKYINKTKQIIISWLDES